MTMYSMPRKACTSARGMLKQQQGITMTAIEEGKAISIIFLFNKPGIQQSGKMGGWVCVPRGGMVQHRVYGLTACFAFARRRRCNGTAGARAWQAGPKPHRPPVPLFLPPLPSYSGSWIQLTPESYPSSSLSPVTPFSVAGTTHLQTKMAKFGFSSIVSALH